MAGPRVRTDHGHYSSDIMQANDPNTPIDPSGGGGVTVTGSQGGSVAATTIQAAVVDDGGSGLAIVKPVVISDSDPGAIGAGNLWLNTAQDAFDDLTNFPLLVRNEADDGWIPVMGDAVGDINLSSYSADGNTAALLQLRAGGSFVKLVLSGASGESSVTLVDTGGDPTALIKVGGVTTVSIRGGKVTIVPPTSDPHLTGALWNDSGTPAISAG